MEFAQIPLVSYIKNSGYFLVFVASVTVLGFDPKSASVLMALMVIDVVTGTIRSGVVYGFPSIKSSIGTKGLLAKLLTLSALMSVAISFQGVGFDARLTISGIISVFILAELYSICGNVYSTLTGKPKDEYDAMLFLVGSVKALLDKYLKK